MSTLIDISGERYGLLEVIGKSANTNEKSSRWLCKCDLCGQVVDMSRKSLLYRKDKLLGCGCASKKKIHKLQSGEKSFRKEGGDTLCWACKLVGKSICEWDREFKPVPGWEAEETKIWISHIGEYMASYRVISCPKKE